MQYRITLQRRMPTGGMQEVVGNIRWHFGYNMGLDSEEFEEMIFDAEKAINANSKIRCHIFPLNEEEESIAND